MTRATIPNLLSGLRLPVIAAPMFLISGPDMVIAACRSGIAGAFPTTNCRTLDEADAWMARIAAGVRPGDGPWIANLVTHSTNPRLAQDLELVAKYKPAIVITALGSPKPVMQTVKAYGGQVFADVINIELARKAAAAGVDGLACISAGAGGHTGDLSPFAFISAVRDFFDGYVAVGGGIADGAGVAGAVAAGADCVYMGTRFLATEESLAAPGYKQMVIDAQAADLLVSAAVTGAPASWLKGSLRAAGYDPEAMGGPAERNYSDAAQKRWRDIWAAGQGVAAVRAMEPVSDVVDQLQREYSAAIDRFAALSSSRR